MFLKIIYKMNVSKNMNKSKITDIKNKKNTITI